MKCVFRPLGSPSEPRSNSMTSCQCPSVRGALAGQVKRGAFSVIMGASSGRMYALATPLGDALFPLRDNHMALNLSEEEMRRALFGSSISAPTVVDDALSVEPEKSLAAKPASRKSPSPRLRVTLRVSKEFEGAEEIISYDASTLSTLLAESEARNVAKKRRFKYIELVSIVPV